ncbi:hypothetical protein K466DRAFT_86143 [Polyporus arcularius HHB13444]|uniref:Uncharacterized protein n=1 Tax=Polyporus arcularius HHB13444 TaxID=1314778 RepID=A0A5C3PFN7_9APHY|nr:hypothetical protein K466DRAFT_86143 [Polyporus arcularius HHB13444]
MPRGSYRHPFVSDWAATSAPSYSKKLARGRSPCHDPVSAADSSLFYRTNLHHSSTIATLSLAARLSTIYSAINMLPSLALSSVISAIPRHVPLSSDHILTGDAPCVIPEAQCDLLQGRLTAAQIHTLAQKAGQRRLRAEIAAFLGERGAIRSANCPVKAEADVTMTGAGQPMDTSANMYDSAPDRYLEDSPLTLRSKRMLALRSSSPESPLKRRGFAMVP